MRAIFHFTAIALLATSGVKAADLEARPRPQPARVQAGTVGQPFSWTGMYIGGNVGGAWTERDVTDAIFSLSADTSRGGVIGGAQAGFNYQFGNFVVGVEGDIDWMGLKTTDAAAFVPSVGTLQGSADMQWISTLALRFGVAYDRLLFYGKAGGALVADNAVVTNVTTGTSAASSKVNNGWLIGAGVEWGFAPNLSTKVEYNYIDFRSWDLTTSAPVDVFTINRNTHLLKVGLNYQFGLDGLRPRGTDH
jgi:outer membrane immunogenic protein